MEHLEESKGDGKTQKLQLFLSCTGLRDKDFIGESDPYCKVYVKNDERSEWEEIGKTNTVDESIDPVFATPIVVDYHFEKTQMMKFKVYDKDNSGKDGLGKYKTPLSKLLSDKGEYHKGSLGDDGKKGEIQIYTECLMESDHYLKIKAECEGLKSKKKMFGMKSSNHPYLLFRRCLSYETSDEDYDTSLKVLQSEVDEDTTDPEWDLGKVSLAELCN